MTNKDGEFQLSARLVGHDKDVRAVCFPESGTVFTASRDCTLQVWQASPTKPPIFASRLLAQSSHSFNSLAFLPKSDSRPQYPSGLVLAGSHNQTIEVRKPDAGISDDRAGLLSGHKGNVSTLSVSPNSNFLVSGDWDGRAKLWNTITWETSFELIGPDPSDKQRAIWAVLAYSNTIFLTGSADHMIRGYSLQNKAQVSGELLPGVLIRTPDVVRALCRVRNHPSAAKIASAGNDFMIRLWQFNGSEVGVLQGHESFIYAVDCFPSGELVSSSEDRTVRIWRDMSCIQTITHPALSIWSVSVCQATGDFATGASDNVARVFTRDADRIASSDVLEEFTGSVQQSSIPQQQVGDINPSTLPGPEFIETKSGTKEGQTVMINSGDGNIGVYQWSMGQRQWLLVGNVVDSSSASAGDPMDTSAVGSARQVPHDTGNMEDSKSSISVIANPPFGPHALFATLVKSRFSCEWDVRAVAVLGRIVTINSGLSDPSISLGHDQLKRLEALVQVLEVEVPQIPTATAAMVPAIPTSTYILDASSIATVLQVATLWPYRDQLPGLDLLRCMATSPSVAQFSDADNRDILEIVLTSVRSFEKDSKTERPVDPRAVENNTMMALRLVANLFVTAPGQQLASQYATLVDFLSASLNVSGTKNRNFMIAWTSAVSNVAAFALREREVRGENAIGLNSLARLVALFALPAFDLEDAEAVYRALVALGNLASISGDEYYASRVRSADVRAWVKLAIEKVAEDRVRHVGEALLLLLGT